MARFSVGGEEDERGRRPIGESSSSKRNQISYTMLAAVKRSKVSSAKNLDAAALASSSNPGLRSSVGQGDVNEEDQRTQGTGTEVVRKVRFISTSKSNAGGCVESAQPLGGSPPIICILTDPDVLDCPICLEALNPPVYECENGHVACKSCCTKMKNKCGSCCLPIGYNRCRAFEKVIESVEIGCSNFSYGCREYFRYGKKLDHESKCMYTPCKCPCCYYSNFHKDLCTHFRTEHSSSVQEIRFGVASTLSLDDIKDHIFLIDKFESALFVLSRSINSNCSFGYIVCIAPTASQREFIYELAAKDGDSSTKLITTAENIPSWTAGHEAKKRFVVLDDFVTSEWEITIWEVDDEAESSAEAEEGGNNS